MVFGVNDESQIAKPDIFECDYGDIYEASFIKKQANENYRENTDSKVYNILTVSYTHLPMSLLVTMYTNYAMK